MPQPLTWDDEMMTMTEEEGEEVALAEGRNLGAVV